MRHAAENDPLRELVESGMTYAQAEAVLASELFPDTYPECGCQPDDCPDREGVERATSDTPASGH